LAGYILRRQKGIALSLWQLSIFPNGLNKFLSRHKEVIGFIMEHIIHRFGIPQILTTDQGTSFVAKEVCDFVNPCGIKLLNSSPYYAQANGQAKSSNKTLVKLIKKNIEDNPKRWHEVLSEALWAHRISGHGATKVTPFDLVYGQEVVLPIDVNIGAYRFEAK
jgi:hypothetical protein